MNRYVRDIMQYLECSAEYASKVYLAMECDFSECTTGEFKRAMNRAVEQSKKVPSGFEHGVSKDLPL